MRILFSGLVAAGLLTSQIAGAAECRPAADTAAFDVAGLKTELMYIALACGAQDRYNAFINKYKGEINSDETLVHTAFTHAYGRNAVKRHDDFTTNLANNQSQTSMIDGNRYCAHNLQVFDEVMALRSPAELPEFAAGRATPPNTLMPSCGGAPERATEHTTRSSRGRNRRS